MRSSWGERRRGRGNPHKYARTAVYSSVAIIGRFLCQTRFAKWAGRKPDKGPLHPEFQASGFVIRECDRNSISELLPNFESIQASLQTDRPSPLALIRGSNAFFVASKNSQKTV